MQALPRWNEAQTEWGAQNYDASRLALARPGLFTLAAKGGQQLTAVKACVLLSYIGLRAQGRHKNACDKRSRQRLRPFVASMTRTKKQEQ